jgi:hypothetical protein
MDLIRNHRQYALYVHTSSLLWRNIFYTKRGFFLPAEFEKKYATGDVMLFHMMLAQGGKISHIQETMSCYRVTGRGVWSKMSKKEQKDFNMNLKRKLSRAIPLKYKIANLIQVAVEIIQTGVETLGKYWKKIQARLPRPINER